MTLSQATRVSVRLADRLVLDELSLQVSAGDQISVTGRSGSGKTTLLLVLAGLLAPASGTVELGVPAREVLYVPQAPSLVPELSALDNATLALRVRGTAPSEAIARARRELEVLGLSDALGALPHALSGGQQQRVALARATAVRPALLLADEPTGSLDHATGATVLDLLTTMATEHGMALVLATHDPQVATYATNRLHLADGHLQETAA